MDSYLFDELQPPLGLGYLPSSSSSSSLSSGLFLLLLSLPHKLLMQVGVPKRVAVGGVPVGGVGGWVGGWVGG